MTTPSTGDDHPMNLDSPLNNEEQPADLRPSKRRRTNNSYARDRTHIDSADKNEGFSNSAKRRGVGKSLSRSAAESPLTSDTPVDGAQQSARRVSRRLRAVRGADDADAPGDVGENGTARQEKGRSTAVEEVVDSAYGSKEDSLVEDVSILNGDDDVIMGEHALRAEPVVSKQSTTSMEIPETPGDEGLASESQRKARSRTHTSRSTRNKSGAVAAVENYEEDVPRATSTSIRKSTTGRRSARKSVESVNDNVQSQVAEETDLVVSESEHEGQAEEITSTRKPSSRSKRPPQRYSIEPESTREPTPVQAAPKRVASTAVPSPKPKGILTPSKGRRNVQRKSVGFNTDEKQIEENLGFKDIDQSTKKKRKSARTSEVASYADDDQDVATAENSVPESSNEADPLLDFDQPFDILQSLQRTKTLPSIEASEDSPAITAIKAHVLSQLTSASPCPPAPHLSTQQATLTNLLRSTIASGESNSLLMLGPRGGGKTLLLEHVLKELTSEHESLFHTVRLNGFVQTDDRLALREIWRQLGRETQAPKDGEEVVEAATTTLSYADTLASLLSLLSHPDEMDIDQDDGDAIMADIDQAARAAKSTILILDEFDLFTLHPRQTLLYNLFDIAQSRKAPIAVIGCSTRMDVVESLEKRVKSRFSHRWLHVPTVRSLAEMTAVVEQALTINPPTGSEANVNMDSVDQAEAERWNECIRTTFLPSPIISHLISQTFYTTKSIPDVLAALYAPICTMSLSSPAAAATVTTASRAVTPKSNLPTTTTTKTQPHSHLISIIHPPLRPPHQHSILQTALSLPLQQLTLLAALLSPSYPSPLPSFHTTYTHYVFLLSRTKLLSSSGRASVARATGPAAGLRQWGRGVCRGVWEGLVRCGVLCAVGGGGKGDGGGEGIGSGVDDWLGVRVEVDEEEILWVLKTRQIKGEAGLGVLAGWVRGDVV